MNRLQKRARKLQRQYLPRYLRGLRLIGAQGRYGAPPHFVVAGMQKCGTNAARYNLDLHPQIHLVQDEVHYFDKKFWLPRWWYENHFLRSSEILSGEATPLYLAKPRAIDRMAALYPDLRIIVLIREPIQRAFSKWNRYRMRVGSVPPFAECLDADFRRLQSNGLYAGHLARLLSRFPRERVYIGIAERIRQHPDREYNEMARFLGLPPFRFDSTKEKHAGRYRDPLDEADLQRLFSCYAGANEELYALLGERIPEWDAFYREHGLG